MTLPILIVSNIQLQLMLTVARNKETNGTTYQTYFKVRKNKLI